MPLTPKQQRNGIPEMGPAGGNVAQPGPTSSVPKAEAEGYGDAWQQSGKAAFDGSGAGTSGFAVADWDQNAAVTEGVGEA